MVKEKIENKNEGSFSIYHKTLNIVIDGQNFDLSNRVSSNIWNIGGDVYPKSTEDEWKIRSQLHTVVKDFIKEFDKEAKDEDIHIII